MEYKKLDAKHWDARCKRMPGYQSVIGSAYPRMESLAETHRQKEYILELPSREGLGFDWRRWVLETHNDGTPYRKSQVSDCDMVVLDVGCGMGRLTIWLAELAKDVVGLDWSIEMLKRANRSFPDMKFVLGDASDSEMFDEGQFDMTFMWNVFSHITDENDWTAAVENMRRWASSYAVFVDAIDQGPATPVLRPYGVAEVGKIMRPWKKLYQGSYTMRIGNSPYQAFDVLIFASPSAIKASKKQDKDEADLVVEEVKESGGGESANS